MYESSHSKSRNQYFKMVQFIEINKASLAYGLAGPESAPLVITLHGGRGFGDHVSDFKAYSPLSENGRYRVMSFDFRGHGQSSRTKPYTFDQIVDDIEGLRRHFAGPATPCVICGGSFGGFLAQHYAIKYPSHVSHLILRGTAPSHHHEDQAVKALVKRLDKAPCLSVEMLKDKIFGKFESDLEFCLVMSAAAPLYSEVFDPNAALAKALQTNYVAESHNDLYAESEKFFDYRADLSKVTAKTLVIVGEKDWICPPQQSMDIASRISNSRLEIVPGANHAVHLEMTSLVLDLIREHLKILP